ncbi:hypothetical protein PO124_28335 [Bacillus licheniformis]|nr:hypothetical protein [Bacillus licheniformis]
MYTVTSYNFDFDKHKQVVLTDVLNNQAKSKGKNYISAISTNIRNSFILILKERYPFG